MSSISNENKEHDLLFKYPAILASIEDTLTKHYQIADKYISHTILSFLSNKNIHLQIGNTDVMPDPYETDPISLIALSVNDNQKLFTITSQFPASWTNREISSCGGSGNRVYLSNNHIWIEYDEDDEDYDDIDMFELPENEYAQMRTHYLLHAEIISNNVQTAQCPVKLGTWKIYYGKKELVRWNGDGTGYNMIPNTDLRNYESYFYFAGDKCLLFSDKYIYKLRENSLNDTKFDIICEWNHSYLARSRIPHITDFVFKHFNIMNVMFLFDGCDEIELNKNDKVISILYNIKDFRIDFLQIPTHYGVDKVIEPPTKKRKVSEIEGNKKKWLIRSMDLNGLLGRLYDVSKIFIHGYYIDVKNECVMIVVNTNDILFIDKECNLMKQCKINDNVFDKSLFKQWWTPHTYVVNIEPTLNGRDFLFVVYSASNSGIKDSVIVNGNTFSRVGSGRFEGKDLRFGFGSMYPRKTCDLSHCTDLFPFIY